MFASARGYNLRIVPCLNSTTGQGSPVCPGVELVWVVGEGARVELVTVKPFYKRTAFTASHSELECGEAVLRGFALPRKQVK